MEKSEELRAIKLVLSGDSGAFRLLVESYQEGVFNLLLRMTKNRHDAEDLAQEAFLKAFKNLHQYKEELSFKNWIFTIASNLCKNKFIRDKIISFIPFISKKDGKDIEIELSISNTSPVKEVEDKEWNITFSKLVETLPLKYREVFHLRYAEGFSYTEIGQITALPAGTVQTYLYRAKTELLKRFSKVEIINGDGLYILQEDK
ncbi:MAG: hypothetical protein A2231_04695 [Candidatus Firestonebacteria bacterium RIFOXYA2_FULL_40_8]|nr:MAG: hypothetical protein A2231_04695 [Candidatus Firestonebacteria bacterium RIFOXYA2_FULL_40_8]